GGEERGNSENQAGWWYTRLALRHQLSYGSKSRWASARRTQAAVPLARSRWRRRITQEGTAAAFTSSRFRFLHFRPESSTPPRPLTIACLHGLGWPLTITFRTTSPPVSWRRPCLT